MNQLRDGKGKFVKGHPSIGGFQKGHKINFGKKYPPGWCRNISKGLMGKSLSKEHKRKISRSNQGKKHGPPSEETRRKISEAHRGVPLSEEHRAKMPKFPSGKDHPNWKGGSSISPYPKTFLNKMRKLARQRDRYICNMCKLKIRGRPATHHINYDKHNNESWNLITLCASCHGKVHSFVHYGECKEWYWKNYFMEWWMFNNPKLDCVLE